MDGARLGWARCALDGRGGSWMGMARCALPRPSSDPRVAPYPVTGVRKLTKLTADLDLDLDIYFIFHISSDWGAETYKTSY